MRDRWDRRYDVRHNDKCECVGRGRGHEHTYSHIQSSTFALRGREHDVREHDVREHDICVGTASKSSTVESAESGRTDRRAFGHDASNDQYSAAFCGQDRSEDRDDNDDDDDDVGSDDIIRWLDLVRTENVNGVRRQLQTDVRMLHTRSPTSNFETALHVAARTGNENMIYLLLEYGADVRALTSNMLRAVDVLAPHTLDMNTKCYYTDREGTHVVTVIGIDRTHHPWSYTIRIHRVGNGDVRDRHTERHRLFPLSASHPNEELKCMLVKQDIARVRDNKHGTTHEFTRLAPPNHKVCFALNALVCDAQIEPTPVMYMPEFTFRHLFGWPPKIQDYEEAYDRSTSAHSSNSKFYFVWCFAGMDLQYDTNIVRGLMLPMGTANLEHTRLARGSSMMEDYDMDVAECADLRFGTRMRLWNKYGTDVYILRTLTSPRISIPAFPIEYFILNPATVDELDVSSSEILGRILCNLRKSNVSLVDYQCGCEAFYCKAHRSIVLYSKHTISLDPEIRIFKARSVPDDLVRVGEDMQYKDHTLVALENLPESNARSSKKLHLEHWEHSHPNAANVEEGLNAADLAFFE